MQNYPYYPGARAKEDVEVNAPGTILMPAKSQAHD